MWIQSYHIPCGGIGETHVRPQWKVTMLGTGQGIENLEQCAVGDGSLEEVRDTRLRLRGSYDGYGRHRLLNGASRAGQWETHDLTYHCNGVQHSE